MPKDIRPTQNVAREALFSLLGHDQEGQTWVDIFAGSGAVGLEALSRGAERAVFVEKFPQAVKVIQENLKSFPINHIGEDPQFYEVIQSDAFAAIKEFARIKRTFDVVFIDPPYGRLLAKKALKTLGAYDILQPNSVVVIQHDISEILPPEEGRILLVEQRKYGSSVFSIYRQAELQEE